MSKPITLVTLGGTIASVPRTGGGVGPTGDPSNMRDLLHEARLTAGGADLEIVDLASVASPAISREQLQSVARALSDIARTSRGIILTTGTDTLEEVAFFLDLTRPRGVPLVVTGAMRHPGSPGADGPRNLSDAFAVASDPEVAKLGCLVVMDGTIHHAWQARKVDTSSVAAFASWPGPVGSVVEGQVRLLAPLTIDRPHFEPDTLVALPPVALLTAALGDEGEVLRLVGESGAAGLVVETMGGGSVPPAWMPHLRTLAADIPVVYSSRVGRGPTLTSTYGGPGSELDLIDASVTPAGVIDGLKARIVLQLLLASRAGRARRAEVWSMFDAPQTTGG